MQNKLRDWIVISILLVPLLTSLRCEAKTYAEVETSKESLYYPIRNNMISMFLGYKVAKIFYGKFPKSEYKQKYQIFKHELLTPISVIKGVCSLCKIEKVNRQTIADSLQQIEEMVVNFDIDSPYHTKRIAINYSFSILELINKVVKQLSYINSNSISIKVNVDKSVPLLRLDKEALHKILTNLLTNSLKYTSIGFVFISVTQSRGSIRIVVEDTGIGMNSEDLKNIFNCSWRSQRVEHIAGNGLGMTIVQKLVDDLKGSIEVQSQINKGTTVSVYLPVN